MTGSWRRRALAVVAAIAATIGPAGLPAAAAAPSTSTTTSTTTGTGSNDTLPQATPGPPPSETEPPVPTSIPPLAPPNADEAGRLRAQAELGTAQRALRTAIVARRKAERAVAPVQARVQAAEARLAAMDAADRKAADELAAARDRVRQFAVAGYVVSGAAPVDYLLKATDPMDLARRRQLVRSATQAKEDALARYDAARQATSSRLTSAVDALEQARNDFRQADSEATAAAQLVFLLQQDVDNRTQLLDLVTAAAPVAPSDIPRLFLDAYRHAAAEMATKAPGCRVSWSAMAAIGKIESNHGRYRGAQLALNGDVYPRILGIPLDGTRTQLVTDTDGGQLDGDATYDRAVGPMQFIPSTWRRIGKDGNGDGVIDPNNAYDAALSTAAYLCRAAPNGGLDTDDGLRPAFFSYNHSDAYVDEVLTWAHTYDSMAPQLPAFLGLRH